MRTQVRGEKKLRIIKKNFSMKIFLFIKSKSFDVFSRFNFINFQSKFRWNSSKTEVFLAWVLRIYTSTCIAFPNYSLPFFSLRVFLLIRLCFFFRWNERKKAHVKVLILCVPRFSFLFVIAKEKKRKNRKWSAKCYEWNVRNAIFPFSFCDYKLGKSTVEISTNKNW